ncbi:hypothetical protein [Geminocystis sp. GBBB08]|uniref:hypothetical protein n=1 Tax=Geminocystis sp. GBBB08 TaxID=2604140 RepID=UPI0027E380F0|nr:hypothetical protein [Geminocystis sp. GBBB08]MBL1210082.1 hypothetical protein [Geminocystis sp. GBBB08]
MKINWFSPLLPAKTDIANYTQIIIYYLQEKIDITLWINQQEWNQALEKYAKVKQYQLDKMPWFELNQADINIYHLGNNPTFYGDIWKISQQSPGLVILHDDKLQDFFYMLYPNKNDYIQQMRDIYGEKGGKFARLFLNGYYSKEFMAENYPLTPLALKNALGVITHNRETYLCLSQQNQWVTAYTPLPYISDDFRNNKGKQIPENNYHPQLYAQAIVEVAKQICEYRHHSGVDRIIQRVASEFNYLNPNIPSNSHLTNISEVIKFITM